MESTIVILLLGHYQELQNQEEKKNYVISQLENNNFLKKQ